MTLDVSYTVDCPEYDTLFKACMQSVVAISHDPFIETEVSLVVVSPQEIQDLNRQYRDKDAVTDVLSFHNWEESTDIFPGYLLGELFICYERAEAQAQQLGHSILEELSTLCIHGLLHLQGHDHIREEDYQEMRAREAQAMTLLKQKNLF